MTRPYDSEQLKRDAADLIRRTRIDKGLSPTLTDEVILRKIAVLMQPRPARRAAS